MSFAPSEAVTNRFLKAADKPAKLELMTLDEVRKGRSVAMSEGGPGGTGGSGGGTYTGGTGGRNDVPMDGGLSILLAAGVGYGVKKVRESYHRK